MEDKEMANHHQVTLKNVSILEGNQLKSTIEKMNSDMKFCAIFNIIYGAIACLTIIGAVIGIPMIIYNLKLKDSADHYRKFIYSNDFFQLNKAVENQEKYFFFNKVVIIILLVFMVLYIIFLMIFGLSMLSHTSPANFS